MLSRILKNTFSQNEIKFKQNKKIHKAFIEHLKIKLFLFCYKYMVDPEDLHLLI